MKLQFEKDKKKVLRLVNQKKKYFFYKEYNLFQSFIRYYSVLVRTPNINVVNNKKFFISKNLLIKIILFFQPIIIKLIPNKIDGIIHVNTRYKMNIVDKIFLNSGLKIGVIMKGFNYKVPSNYNKISKFFFSEKDFDNEDLYLVKEINTFEKIFNFYSPKFAFSLEGDSYVDTLISEICKNKKIPHFCLQHGINHPFIINKNLKYKFKKYFYNFIYLSRSLTHVKFLQQKGLIKKFHIYKEKKKLKREKEKKDILFCFPPLYEGVEKINIIKAIKFVNETAKKYPDIKVITRPHPNGSVDDLIQQKLAKLKNLINESPNEVSLEDAFKKSLVSIFFNGSSSIMDALQNNTIPIIYHDNKWFNINYLNKKKLGYISLNEKNCKKFLDKILSKDKLRKLYFKRIQKFNKTHFHFKNSKTIINIIKTYI